MGGSYFSLKYIGNILHANIDINSRRLIAELPGDGVKCILKLQSHSEKMTFSDKSRYDRIFQKFTHKGWNSAMKYIKRFQNEQVLSVSVVNNYSEDQLIPIFLDDFHHSGKCTAQIANQQAEIRRGGNFTDQKYLSITSLQTDYLNLDKVQILVELMREQLWF